MLLLVSGKLDLEICIDEFTSGQSFLLSVENWGVELLIRVEKNNHYSCAKTEELSLSLSLSLSNTRIPVKHNTHSLNLQKIWLVLAESNIYQTH
jgi:hypothetical protein